MGIGRAQEHGMGLARRVDIVGEPPGAGDEAHILLAADGLADAELSQG
jgi:hypothetical protein